MVEENDEQSISIQQKLKTLTSEYCKIMNENENLRDKIYNQERKIGELLKKIERLEKEIKNKENN